MADVTSLIHDAAVAAQNMRLAGQSDLAAYVWRNVEALTTAEARLSSALDDWEKSPARTLSNAKRGAEVQA